MPGDALQNARARNIALAAVVAVTAIVYLPTLRFGWAADDLTQILDNYRVHDWKYAAGYFTEHVFANIIATHQGNYYRPFFQMWLLINWSLWAANPLAWHAVTVLMHLIVTAQVFRLALRLFAFEPGEEAGPDATATAALAALLFGVHPLHAETVAWVCGVTESLVSVFFLASWLCYLNWREGGPNKRAWLALSLLAFVSACFSKENALILPALIAVWEFLSHTGGIRERIRFAVLPVAPFALFSVLYFVLRAYALGGGGAHLNPVPFVYVLYTLPWAAWFYLHQLLLPYPISPNYDTHYFHEFDFAHGWLPLVSCLAALAVLYWLAQRSRLTTFLVTFLLLPIAVPLAALPAFDEYDLVHDRYLYVSTMAACMLLSLLWRAWSQRIAANSRLLPKVLAVLAVAASSMYAYAMSLPWHDNMTLYPYAAAHAPNNLIVQSVLANELLRHGRNEEALAGFRRVVALDPQNAKWHFILGLALNGMNRTAEAEPEFRRATELNPDNAAHFYFLGIARFRLNDLAGAETAYRNAVRLMPESAAYHYELANTLYHEGKKTESRDELLATLTLDPNYPGARGSLKLVEN